MPFSVTVRRISQEFGRANPGKDDGRSEIATHRGSVMVLQTHGNINRDIWPRLVEKASELLNQGIVNLVFDLHQVEDITRGGLIALQTIAERAARRGGKAVVCRPTC
jgi:anti-anti-sigma regulatory factor